MKELDAATIFETSAEAVGLPSDTSPAIRARFEGVVNAMNVALDGVPASIVGARLRRVLERRLGMVADRERLAGIATVAIDQPIFVVGFARTGTTLLHCLLAELPGCR